MTTNEMNRLAVVRDLLELSKPLEEISAQLAAMRWDYDGDGIELTRSHLVAALRRYIDDQLSASDIEVWANGIEGREDIRFEAEWGQEVEDVLYELANPTLTQVLDRDRARVILDKLLGR